MPHCATRKLVLGMAVSPRSYIEECSQNAVRALTTTKIRHRASSHSGTPRCQTPKISRPAETSWDGVPAVDSASYIQYRMKNYRNESGLKELSRDMLRAIKLLTTFYALRMIMNGSPCPAENP